MKKTLFTAIIATLALTATAQDKYYGAEEGGFAISFNANPVLNYLGNMFNGTSNNRLENFKGMGDDALFQGTTITGKYFLKDNLAIVAGFGFDNVYKDNFQYDAKDKEKEVSYTTDGTTKYMIEAGIEYRLQPGKRLQPLFGVNVVYNHQNEYDYFKQEEGKTVETYSSDPVNRIGLLANVGVEYFITTQISVGANLDLGFSKAWFGRCVDNDPDDDKVNYDRIKSSQTDFKTANVGGNVSLNFYF